MRKKRAKRRGGPTAATIRTDAPAAGFFLLGTGAGVWIAAVSRGIGEFVGTVLLVIGVVVLTSRYFGFPIRALRPTVDVRRQELAKQLGEKAQEAQDHVAECFRGLAGLNLAEDAADGWELSTHGLIEKALGRGEAHVFRVGLSQEPDSKAAGWTMQFYDTRAHRLSDLISRLPQLEILDSWHP